MEAIPSRLGEKRATDLSKPSCDIVNVVSNAVPAPVLKRPMIAGGRDDQVDDAVRQPDSGLIADY